MLVTGRISIGVLINGQAKLLQSLFLSVWAGEDGDWRLIAWASTPMPAAGGH